MFTLNMAGQEATIISNEARESEMYCLSKGSRLSSRKIIVFANGRRIFSPIGLGRTT